MAANLEFLLILAISVNFFVKCTNSFPIPNPQGSGANSNFETGLSAGISPTNVRDDCIEAAVNAGAAANDDVGVDLKLLAVNTGGVRCKQGNFVQ